MVSQKCAVFIGPPCTLSAGTLHAILLMSVCVMCVGTVLSVALSCAASVRATCNVLRVSQEVSYVGIYYIGVHV